MVLQVSGEGRVCRQAQRERLIAEAELVNGRSVASQCSRMRRLPETILFSKIDPGGMSILSPWLAMMITVPCKSYSTIHEGLKYADYQGLLNLGENILC